MIHVNLLFLGIPELEQRITKEINGDEKRQHKNKAGMFFYQCYILCINNHTHSVFTPTKWTYSQIKKKSHQNSCYCAGCTKPNCGQCKMCLDIKKFGSLGKIKKKCLQRLCVAHRVTHQIKVSSKDLDTTHSVQLDQ